nr:group II intron maturase-specific domain-containing protein [Mycobacterium sp. DBP42]
MNQYVRGWMGYFRLADTPRKFRDLDGISAAARAACDELTRMHIRVCPTSVAGGHATNFSCPDPQRCGRWAQQQRFPNLADPVLTKMSRSASKTSVRLASGKAARRSVTGSRCVR